MADGKKLQPIIIKRIKKGGHGAHGGAWKIAYADFVTAMMAFFLLMWLLGSTTEGDKKGIADYFNSPLKVAFFGGSGAGDATSIIKGGGNSLTSAPGQLKQGETPTRKRDPRVQPQQVSRMRAEQLAIEKDRLKGLQQRVEQMLISSPKLTPYSNQIQLDMTRDGLRIQIVDDQNRPMFDSGSAVVKPYMRELLHSIGEVLSKSPNKLTLEGHTDAAPYSGDGRGYTNWELSADRANASRRELLAGGLSDAQVLRVQGLAASTLFEPQNPNSPTNRRISIIVMNQDAQERLFSPLDAAETPASSPSEAALADLPPQVHVESTEVRPNNAAVSSSLSASR
jgi:chemotaxis protein MotB